MTTPENDPALVPGPITVLCDSCGQPTDRPRRSPLNREDKVCRFCHQMLSMVESHPVENATVTAAVATFVANTDTRAAERQAQREQREAEQQQRQAE